MRNRGGDSGNTYERNCVYGSRRSVVQRLHRSVSAKASRWQYAYAIHPSLDGGSGTYASPLVVVWATANWLAGFRILNAWRRGVAQEKPTIAAIAEDLQQ